MISSQDPVVKQFAGKDKCDPNKEYFYHYHFPTGETTCTTGFTQLMMLVLQTGVYPELEDRIRTEIPDEELDKQTTDGTTALMMACIHTNSCSTENTVRILLERGCSPTIKNNIGYSVLSFLCDIPYNTTAETFRLLLNTYKFDVNEKLNYSPASLLSAMCMDNQEEVPDLLEIVSLLIDYGFDVNFTDENGDSALIQAVWWSSDRDLISLLIKNGAIINNNVIKELDEDLVDFMYSCKIQVKSAVDY